MIKKRDTGAVAHRQGGGAGAGVIYLEESDRKCQSGLFLLVTVFSYSFFTLVCGHFVAFSFLSAGHSKKI